VKSYSKTKPLRVEEFAPIEAWWGKESDGFAARTESEQAWKIDFKTLKQEAEARAKPHWDKAESLNNDASALVNQIKDLRESIKGEKNAAKRTKAEHKITAINEQIEALRQQAKDEQATGDRHYWPIYNLDITNPHIGESVSHDPAELLATYARQQSEIQALQDQLKSILSEALSR
jgi:type I restriction enzyme M protein